MSFEAFTVYERHLARAKEVVRGAPFRRHIDNEDFARLTVDGDQATISWLRETDRLSVSFPVALLTMSEADFSNWKAIGDEEMAEQALLDEEARREASERQAFERLKFD